MTLQAAASPSSYANRAIFYTAERSGLNRLLRWSGRRKLLVVCYHGVARTERVDGAWLQLPTPEFTKQIAHLAANYQVLFIDDAVARLKAGKLDRPTACITFDDGYLNNYVEAFPVLKSLNLPATVYLTTGLIGTDKLLWTTTLALAFGASVGQQVDLSRLALGIHHISNHAKGKQLAERITKYLKVVSPAERDHHVADILRQLPARDADRAADYVMMEWGHVHAMADSGLVTFGGHTVNHEIVANLDDVQMEAEVDGSIRSLREQLGRRADRAMSTTFAYPNGRRQDFDSRAMAALRREGCTAALSTIEGLNDHSVDPFEIRRVVIGGTCSFEEFSVRTSGLVNLDA